LRQVWAFAGVGARWTLAPGKSKLIVSLSKNVLVNRLVQIHLSSLVLFTYLLLTEELMLSSGCSRVVNRASLYGAGFGPKFYDTFNPNSATMQSLQIHNHLFTVSSS